METYPTFTTKPMIARTQKQNSSKFSSGVEIVPGNPFAKLDELFKQEEEPTGPEWFTAEEFAAHYGISAHRARSILLDLYKNDKVERWKGTSSQTRRTLCKYRAK